MLSSENFFRQTSTATSFLRNKETKELNENSFMVHQHDSIHHDLCLLVRNSPRNSNGGITLLFSVAFATAVSFFMIDLKGSKVDYND